MPKGTLSRLCNARGTPSDMPRKQSCSFQPPFRDYNYPPYENASTASSDSSNIDEGSLPSGMRSFLGHVPYTQCCTEPE